MRNTSLIFGLAIVIAGAWAAQAGADGPIVIFSEVAGDPTAEVPGLPAGTEFDSFDRIYQSPDGSMWIMSASSNLPTSEDEVIIIGFGPTSAGSAVVVSPLTIGCWAACSDSAGMSAVQPNSGAASHHTKLNRNQEPNGPRMLYLPCQHQYIGRLAGWQVKEMYILLK